VIKIITVMMVLMTIMMLTKQLHITYIM